MDGCCRLQRQSPSAVELEVMNLICQSLCRVCVKVSETPKQSSHMGHSYDGG